MKIGACQFCVTGSIASNFQRMMEAVFRASQAGVRLLTFPECALTGYPPHDLASASLADFTQVASCLDALDMLAKERQMYLVVGAITREDGLIYNSAVVFAPQMERQVYHKRALWGWDRDQFQPGNAGGVFTVDGFKIGVRICYEIRFPEYFRELYRQNTDLNIVLFYDRSSREDCSRYDLIKAHVRTRAVENVCHTLSVNSVGPYQTAPTALFDRSGNALMELERGKPGLLVCDLNPSELDFGERGRKEISDALIK